MKQPNLYEILHVGQNAPIEVIKAAYKGLANIYHPDKYKGTDANEKMNQIRQAYETLTDENKRAAYDAFLKKTTESKNKASTNQNPKFKYPNANNNNPPQTKILKAKHKNPIVWWLFCLVVISTIAGLGFFTGGFFSKKEQVAEVEATAPETVSSNAYSSAGSSIDDDEVLMRSAVERFYKTLKDSGIFGAVAEIKECYSDANKTKLYCFYMDYAARIFDASMSENLNRQPQEYFDDKNFYERIYVNIYGPLGFGMNEANNHLKMTGNKIAALLFNRRTPKSR